VSPNRFDAKQAWDTLLREKKLKLRVRELIRHLVCPECHASLAPYVIVESVLKKSASASEMVLVDLKITEICREISCLFKLPHYRIPYKFISYKTLLFDELS
jgi:RNase P subunit RPR2